MLLVDGEKYACIRCIRGHRSSTCKHRQRPLVQVRRRGRPVAECNHRLAVLPDGTCECGVAAIILPKVRSGSTFAPVIEEGEGGKRKIQDTSEDAHQRVVLIRQGSGSCCGGAQTTSSATEQSTTGRREYENERSALVGTTATKQRVIYDPSSVEIQEIEAQTTPKGGVKLKRSGSSSSSLSSDRSTAATTTVKSEDGNEVSSCCGEKAEASCCGGQQADGQRRPIKLRSVVLKPDVDSAAIVRTLDMAQQSLPAVQSVEYYPPQVGLGSQAAAAGTQYGRETMKAGGEYENEDLYSNASPTVAYDEALYSLEAYLQASSQEQAQPYASHNLLMQEAAGVVSQAQQAAAAVSSSGGGSGLQTLSQQEIESLTRYSSRTGVVSYPTGRIGGFTGGEGVQMGTYGDVYVPEGVQLSTSQKELADHMTLLQQQPQQQVDEDGLDNLFSVYLTSACAVPGGTCMCSDECNCPGCMKHGNVFVGENEGREEGFGLEWGR